MVLGPVTDSSDGNWVQWDERNTGLGDISIFSDPLGEPRHLIRLRIFRDGRVQVQTIDVPDGTSGFASTENLSSRWESYDRAVVVEAVGVSPDLVITGPTSSLSVTTDTTEAYAWTQGNGSDQQTWFDAYTVALYSSVTIVLTDGFVSHDYAINAGDVAFAFAVPEPSVDVDSMHEISAGNANFEFAIPQPSVTHIGVMSSIDAGDIAWTFAIPQPVVTHTSRVPDMHSVNAGDATFDFAVPQPGVTYTPRVTDNFTIDAGDVAFFFVLPQLAVSRFSGNTVDAGDAAFEFTLPQLTVTRTRTRNPGDVSYSFAVPQPTVSRFQFASPGNVNYVFSIPQVAVTHIKNRSVDVGNVNFNFEIVQTTVFHISAPIAARAPRRARFLTAMPTGETSIDLFWDIPISDGGSPITHYEICVIDEDGRAQPFEATGADTRATVRGLGIGHRYGFRVRSVNAAGTGEQTELVYGIPKRERIAVIPPGQRFPLLDVDRQSLIVRIADLDCRVRVYWSVSGQAWFGDLEVPVNTAVVQGVRLAVGSGILDRIQGVLPGNIVCRNLDLIDELEPARDAWVRPTHALVWEPN